MSWEMGGLEKVRTAPTMELPQEHTYTLTHTHTHTHTHRDTMFSPMFNQSEVILTWAMQLESL